jgi:Icc-related predicted phosphoesterase
LSAVLGVIGDIHARWPLLEQVLNALATGPKLDGVLLVGDFACAGRGARQSADRKVEYLLEVDRILTAVKGLGVDVVFVPGNHDRPDLGGWGNIDGKTTTIGGLRVGGIGGAGPDRMGFAYEWAEEEIRNRPALDVDVLVSHCPPAGTPFDRLPNGNHVGSQAVLERVQTMHGVAVFGHIHEAHGVGQIGECLCLNPGGLGPPMAHPRAGWVFGTDAVVLKDLRNEEEQRAERQSGR